MIPDFLVNELNILKNRNETSNNCHWGSETVQFVQEYKSRLDYSLLYFIFSKNSTNTYMWPEHMR